jgi:hypothetical protein
MQNDPAMRTMICGLALVAALGVKAQTNVQRTYHPNGTVQEVRVAEADKVTFVRYYDNGKVYERGAFVNSQRDGVWKRYDAQGQVVAKVRFKNGVRDGKCLYAGLPDGSRFKVEYANGRLVHGEQFDPQGNMLAERDMH